VRIFRGIAGTVVALGFVSFLTDFSSEMIYPLLPIFLTQVLGAGALALGVIEGVAETTAAIFKIASGFMTDKLRKRKVFIFAGYGLSGLVRPLIGIARNWPFVLTMRFFDRVGKGVRTSPRDALIADVTEEQFRGAAFGLQRALDHAGAVLGPIAAAFLIGFGLTLRHIFLLAFIPAVLVILIIIFGVKEQPPKGGSQWRFNLRGDWRELGRDFRRFLAAVFIFTLGNSTDAFLLLRLSDVGASKIIIPLLWSLHHIVKMSAAFLGGRVSDILGRRKMVLFGWGIYALVYLSFAMFHTKSALIATFIVYGLYFGLTEPVEKAWVADLAAPRLRGTAFGYYNGVIGLGALPASLIFGLIWKKFGAPVAFLTGACLAALASAMILRVRERLVH